jgi:hypothetical protein
MVDGTAKSPARGSNGISFHDARHSIPEQFI